MAEITAESGSMPGGIGYLALRVGHGRPGLGLLVPRNRQDPVRRGRCRKHPARRQDAIRFCRGWRARLAGDRQRG